MVCVIKYKKGPLFFFVFICCIMKLVNDMESLERLQLLMGKDAIAKLKQSTVVIVGLGGVGGYAVETLARSGIGTFILVDYDTIEITNINRQLVALHSTIGKNKAESWKERIHDINPNCNVIVKNMFLTKENIEEIIDRDVDFIVDACDTLKTKEELIRLSVSYHIPLIASMGMGNKLDPSKVSVMELQKTSYDPLAKHLRKMVRDEKIKEKIIVVSSIEQPIPHQEIIASSAFVPAIAGILLAEYVVRNIVGEL